MSPSFNHCRTVLMSAGLRPTRQRLALAKLLFERDTTRHVTAEQIFTEAKAIGVQLSLATVYNSLHQFTRAGLLREVMLEAGRVHFDTNVTKHHHLVRADTGEIQCIPEEAVRYASLPLVPEGHSIERIDVVIRTRPAPPTT